MAGKKRDISAGLKMATNLANQESKDLAKLKKMAKKPGRIKMGKPTDLNIKNASIIKPTTLGINKATIMKAEHGGEVMNTTRATQLSPITGEPI